MINLDINLRYIKTPIGTNVFPSLTSIIIDQSYQYTLSEVLEATAPLSGADRHYVARCKQMLTPPLVYALNSEFNLLNSLKMDYIYFFCI